MKRLALAVTFIASLGLVAASCGLDNNSPTSPSSTPAPSPSPTPTPTPTPTPAPAPTPALASLTLDPSVFDGGRTTTGTATLDAAAPAGGQVVTLSSSEPANATPPASVTVAEGQTSKTFDIPTRAQTVDVSITLTGSSGGQTRTALMRLRPRSSASSNISIRVDSNEYGQGSDKCLITGATSVDCDVSLQNAPGNLTVAWTWTIGSTSDESSSTGNSSSPPHACSFLGSGTTSEDDTGKYVTLDIKATYTSTIGDTQTTGGPYTKSIKLYTQNFCGY